MSLSLALTDRKKLEPTTDCKSVCPDRDAQNHRVTETNISLYAHTAQQSGFHFTITMRVDHFATPSL